MSAKYKLFSCGFFIALLLSCFVNKANAQACLDSIYHGRATFYTVVTEGACSFPVPASPIYTVSMNIAQYDTAASCGGCISVTNANGTIVLSVEDYCTGCGLNNIDVSEDAEPLISALDTPTAIKWKYVGCPVSGNVDIYFTLSDQYYTHFQVRNHRYPVRRVEYKSGSQYIPLPRSTDNHFTGNNIGVGPYDLRITDWLGDVIEETDVPLINDSIIQGKHQFPECITSGIEETAITNAGIVVQNNPSANGHFTILNKSDIAIDYSVSDILGRKMEVFNMPASSQSIIHIQSKGIYLLSYKLNGNKQRVTKLVVN